SKVIQERVAAEVMYRVRSELLVQTRTSPILPDSVGPLQDASNNPLFCGSDFREPRITCFSVGATLVATAVPHRKSLSRLKGTSNNLSFHRHPGEGRDPALSRRSSDSTWQAPAPRFGFRPSPE